MAAGLKAGIIIGLVILFLFALQFGLTFVSADLAGLFGCLVLLLVLGLWFVAGIMAGRSGGGAGAGALAGLVAAAIGGLGNMILAVFSVSAGKQQLIALLTPETIRALEQSGIPPETFVFVAGIGGVFVLCCILGPIVAAVFGAIGGLIGRRPVQPVSS